MAKKKGPTGGGLDVNPDKLLSLEALFGTQKKAAQHLGINVSTFRAIKTGKATSKKTAERINRVYGQNKKKITPDTEKKIERKRETSERRRQAREPQRQRGRMVIEGTNVWLNREYGGNPEAGYIVKHLEGQSVFVAYQKGEPEGVLFTDDPNKLGKQKGQLYITLIGLFTLNYIAEKGGATEGNSDLKKIPVQVLVDLDKEWTYEQTRTYAENKFLDLSYQVGRRKFNPTQFIGFEL